MTEFERNCLKAAMKHFMADADNEQLCFDNGMAILSALSKAPYQGQRERLMQLLALSSSQPVSLPDKPQI